MALYDNPIQIIKDNLARAENPFRSSSSRSSSGGATGFGNVAQMRQEQQQRQNPSFWDILTGSHLQKQAGGKLIAGTVPISLAGVGNLPILFGQAHKVSGTAQRTTGFMNTISKVFSMRGLKSIIFGTGMAGTGYVAVKTVPNVADMINAIIDVPKNWAQDLGGVSPTDAVTDAVDGAGDWLKGLVPNIELPDINLANFTQPLANLGSGLGETFTSIFNIPLGATNLKMPEGIDTKTLLIGAGAVGVGALILTRKKKK